MFAGWRRLSREKRKIWTFIGCGMVGMTGIKAGYFYFTRHLIVTQGDRRHKEAVTNLQEAYEFADWSHQEREKQLPDLTPEQRRQMNNYLNLMMEHEMKKHFPEDHQDAGTTRQVPPAPRMPK